MQTFAIILLVSALALPFPVTAQSTLTDGQIKEQIIMLSISAYSGRCACPYNKAKNGSKCGKRSAWSKAGGYTPICYQEEITDKMVKSFRERNSLN